MTKAYLLGALHDGTIRKTTCRIGSKDQDYIKFLAETIKRLGSRAWTYQEGNNRHFYVVEFSKSVLKNCLLKTRKDKIDYVRGYFDAEGGVSRSDTVRYYIYFAQKNLKDLRQVRDFIEELGIKCGTIHNPSKTADSDYWRFFIRAQSYEKFAKIIGSWHPAKRHFLRMKI